jgi:hypothetical protein
MSWRLLTLTATLLLPLTVQAADLPKSGTDSYTNTWVVTASSSMKLGEDRSFDTYETSGVSRNDAGGAMFNNFGLRILGSGEVAGNERIDRGASISTDKDGDQIFSTYEGKAGAAGTFKLVGGTGKFTGISGTGEFSLIAFFIDSDDKRARGVFANKATWKLP